MSKKLDVSKTQFAILTFLSQYPGRSWHVRGLARGARISHGSAGAGLKRLERMGFLRRERQGNMVLYSLRDDAPLVRQLRAFLTLLHLEPLVEEVKDLCHRIVLFGSAKDGDETEGSDVDLLLVTSEGKEVRRRLRSFPTVRGMPLNAVVMTPSELAMLSRQNPSFHGKASGGMVLWRRMDG
jgi:predicted nucleotidyltransferase